MWLTGHVWRTRGDTALLPTISTRRELGQISDGSGLGPGSAPVCGAVPGPPAALACRIRVLEMV